MEKPTIMTASGIMEMVSSFSAFFFLFLLNKLNRGNNDLLKKMDLFCTGRRDFFISPMAGV